MRYKEWYFHWSSLFWYLDSVTLLDRRGKKEELFLICAWSLP